MAISTIHRLDKVAFPSSVNFVEVTNMKWNAGIEMMLERPAGHIYPMFAANQKQKATIEFTTPQIETVLGAMTVGGAAFGAISTYFKAASTTGSVARATLGHKRVVVNSSIGYWSSIRLPHNGRAEASVMIAANYDGSNNPFVYTGSIALAGNITATEYFGAGPVSINGTSIPGVQDITIESGITLTQEGGESELWDTFTGIEQGNPVVTITTREMVNWSTIGLAGLALNGSTGLSFYARKYSANGSRVANATAQHIKFDGILGMAIPMDSSGDGTAPISDTIKVHLTATSDSVLPLIATTSSAIS